MKKYLKYIECFFMFIAFCMVVFASKEEVDKAKEAMLKYCQHDYQGLKGCIYDPNDTLYTKVGKWSNEDFVKITLGGGEQLARGYVTANAKGELIFAGCYKSKLNPSSTTGGGRIFAFKIVQLDGNKCKMTDGDIVPAKGVWLRKNYDVAGLIYEIHNYTGQESIGSQMATYIDWTATENGECPIGFGLVANTRWYTSTKHRYVFSNDGTGFNIGVNSFFGGEAYVTTPGCTVLDEVGHKEALECFNEAKANIEKTKCPSDYTELAKLSGTLEKYQDSCDNKWRTLYSKGLLEKDAEEMKEKLTSAVTAKLSSCQADKCSLTGTQVAAIESNLTKTDYKLCKSGNCPADTSKSQSTDENAKCYRIGNGNASHFEWTTTPSAQPYYEEPTMKKSECYGNYDTRNCRDCLKRAYKASGLNTTQIDCMLELEGQKTKIDQDSKEEIDQQFDDKTEQKLQENQQIIDNSYKSYELPDIDVELPKEDSSLTECIKIIGSDLAAIIKVSITILQIVGAIIAVVKGMMVLIPPILAKKESRKHFN